MAKNSNNCFEDEEAFYLEKREIDADSEDGYAYDGVGLDEEIYSEAGTEDLDTAVRKLQELQGDTLAAEQKFVERSDVTHLPEPVDDFIRNFLVKMQMHHTMECFQNEWYEKIQRNELQTEDIGYVPEVYQRNQELDTMVKISRSEVEKYRAACQKAKDTCIRLRKERDFHRMHHRRVVQEKQKLLDDVKRLQNHYRCYEPTLEALKKKYEAAISQKSMLSIERDRALGQVAGLQSTLRNLESLKGNIDYDKQLVQTHVYECGRGAEIYTDQTGKGPTQQLLLAQREKHSETLPDIIKGHPQDSDFPIDNRVNPALTHVKGPSGHLTRTGGFRLSSTNDAHAFPVSGLALHPRKQILATAGDDHTWRMWSVPGAELIMCGEGHKDWVSSVDFHPSGAQLASGSGDTTVKLWEFTKTKCLHTFNEHQQPVWRVSFHSCGDFIASASNDCSIKIFDLGSIRCRFTLRGHADSVNSVEFLPYSNILVSGSADKTLSLWDARQGICAQTFFGHMHSVNDAKFNLKGDSMASCDAFGVVKIWDVRACSPLTTFDVGPHSANQVAFDPACSVLAIASNDSTIKMYEMSSGKLTTLAGHEDAVQSVIFDRNGEYLVSSGSDCTVRIWS